MRPPRRPVVKHMSARFAAVLREAAAVRLPRGALLWPGAQARAGGGRSGSRQWDGDRTMSGCIAACCVCLGLLSARYVSSPHQPEKLEGRLIMASLITPCGSIGPCGG